MTNLSATIRFSPTDSSVGFFCFSDMYLGLTPQAWVPGRASRLGCSTPAFRYSPVFRESLSSIAEASRESVGAMSDIVWAVNPRKDRLSELIKRMRRFGSDVLSA